MNEQSERPARFSAFQHRNFRLFWTGNVLSLVGTLAQDTARGWLVRSLTANAFTIAAVAACGSLPILFLTLYAGAVADNVDKRRALILTNCLAMFLAALFAVLTFFHLIAVWHVAVLALLLGAVNAFDIPVRQAFNVEMVGRADLPNAIALNSTAFNSARVAGPAVGGFLIETFGLAGCFALNALSFVALILGLSRMKIEAPVVQKAAPKLSDIREGYEFVRRDPVLWPLTLLVAVVSIFGMSYGALLPIFAKDVFRTGAAGFSHLLTASGAGSLLAAVSLAVSGKMQHKGKRVLLGAFLFCGCIAGFGGAPNLNIACVLLALAGWALLTFLMTANTLVQTKAPDEMRGRVFSLYSLALIGTGPLGALLSGALAQASTPRLAVEAGAGIAAIFVLWTYARHRDLWKEK